MSLRRQASCPLLLRFPTAGTKMEKPCLPGAFQAGYGWRIAAKADKASSTDT
jgi:hypothetical protein